MLKKIDYTKLNVGNNQEIFSCPICKSKMFLVESTLKCEKNHSFDISRKGCISLMKANKLRNDKVYDYTLFKNRTEFINGSFYDKLHELIASIVNKNKKSSIIVDMGSGDGTHDNKIYNLLDDKKGYLFGIDIAKEGIEYSSSYVQNNFVPIVADLNNLPFQNNSIDVILNILSPSNEQEMRRVLKKDGIIIKVTPKKGYLQELREALEIKEYENENIIDENIRKNYIVKEKYEIIETYNLSKERLLNLVEMTPLLKNYNKDVDINCITIALNVYVLVPKE